ncbi:dolichyl-phosphate-mannose--protein mannosyltransferase [Allostreptomyces psammosilenae]|uniref:Polyprenol-phosphate-mannose--protein mannosyltransferase n=1 Tax=Allostreptomyces psammosilenae TaxID=1892865 RepID=A0A853ABX2_9ACTN|nr:phospholipid carrier-dependent glycosyltransferase [Allostreptomyces psammosilenae]NYI07872.1 dolichyl-phosphate-mannose--protein O-mannosyl transferase [Allostreptomyces psammosilenae]
MPAPSGGARAWDAHAAPAGATLRDRLVPPAPERQPRWTTLGRLALEAFTPRRPAAPPAGEPHGADPSDGAAPAAGAPPVDLAKPAELGEPAGVAPAPAGASPISLAKPTGAEPADHEEPAEAGAPPRALAVAIAWLSRPGVAGWIGPLLVTALAGVLRLWNLGQPHAVIFDETYYAKDAWSLLQRGYESSWPDNANDAILATPPSVPLGDDAAFIVHPPVGKWTIALGEWLFGMDPFGWRIAVAVLGTLSVLMLARIGRRLFRSTMLGCLAALLMTVDGLHLVMSRTALLDGVLMFWVLAGFGCLLIDRDRSRGRLADLVGDVPDSARATAARLGWRPWRLAGGLCLGLATATKWSGLFYVAAFGIMIVLWDAGARRLAGAERPYRTMLRRDALPAFGALVPVTIVVYLVSWVGWFASDDGYYRQWAADRAGSSPQELPLPGFRGLSVPLPHVDMTWVPAALRSLWHYHAQMFEFHTNLTSHHDYQSNPWSWLVLGRPVSFFYESPGYGEDGCTSQECAREVLGMGTPLLWWTACVALLYLLYRWAARRDWRAGAILVGVAAGLLPWFNYQERTIFLFYAVVFVPFLCLAVAMMLGAMLGPHHAGETRRAVGTFGAGVVLAAIVLNFVAFWPIFTGQTIPMDSWRDLMWLRTWI